jgi:hypothetical protein
MDPKNYPGRAQQAAEAINNVIRINVEEKGVVLDSAGYGQGLSVNDTVWVPKDCSKVRSGDIRPKRRDRRSTGTSTIGANSTMQCNEHDDFAKLNREFTSNSIIFYSPDHLCRVRLNDRSEAYGRWLNAVKAGYYSNGSTD